MVRKASATTQKRATKPTRTSKISRASSKPHTGQQRDPRHPLASPLASEPSLVDRVEAQRVQIMKALSIIECCKYASATLLHVEDSEYMVPAFETVDDLLSTVAEELEHVASSVRRLTEPRE